MVNYEQMCRGLGIPDGVDFGKEHWASSQAVLPGDGKIAFLEPGFVEGISQTPISAEVRAALVDALGAFHASRELRCLAWHCHWLLFSEAKESNVKIAEWPKLPGTLEERAPLFYAIVCLSGFPCVQAMHRKRNIPEAITSDTLEDLDLWIRHHKAHFGRWGFKEMNWLTHHLSGILVRLGRLQFCFEQYPSDFRGFRRRGQDRWILLAEAGLKIRSDGQFADANGQAPHPSIRETRFLQETGRASGSPVTPKGAVSAEIETFDLEQWEEVLHKGDVVLGVHIPDIGPLVPSTCDQSFRQALHFFSEHFRDRPFTAFTCHSWLMDPQLEDHLPEKSNIVSFLERFHLHPLPAADHRQTYERVFGDPEISIEQAPQTTSLQKTIAHHARSGGHWRLGGGIIFPPEIQPSAVSADFSAPPR